jgi:GAF domain-containing protein
MNPRLLLALIPLGWALVRLPTMLSFVNNLTLLSITLMCLAMYVLACWLAGELRAGVRAGYMYFAVSVAWLSVGLEAALLVVIVGSGLHGVLLHRAARKANRDIRAIAEVAGRIATIGCGVVLAFGLHVNLQGIVPLATLTYPTAAATLLVLFSGFVVVHAIGLWITHQQFRLTTVPTRVLMHSLLMLVAVALPLILYQVSILAFAAIMGVIAFQAIQQNFTRHTQFALEQRIKEMTALYNLGQSIASNRVLDEVLFSVYDEVNRLVNATTFFIALYDADRGVIRYPLAMTEGQHVRRATRPLGDGMTDAVLRNKQPLLIHRQDIQRLQQFNIHPEEVESASYLGVPLLVGKDIIGVLGVLHATQETAFNASDVTILQTIANQTSLAIRNATLYNRTLQLVDNLALINRSVQEVISNLDGRGATRSACLIALQVTSAHKAAIFMLQQEPTLCFVLKHSVGFVPDGTPLALATTYRPEQFLKGSRAVSDVREIADDILQQQAQMGGFAACLEVPMRSGDNLLGYLAVYHHEVYYYETPEINLLEMLASQVAAVLDNSALVHELETYASEQAQLVHLSRISSSNLNLERTIQSVGSTLAQMLNLSEVVIGLLDPPKKMLRVYRGTSDTPLAMAQETIPEFATTLAGNTADMQIFQQTEVLSTPLRAFMQAHQTQTLATMPMLINQDSIGIIILENRTPRRFTENELHLLEMATGQITAQLHNASIHTLTEVALIQRLEQMALIEDIAGQISQSLDSEKVIQSVLEAALQATGADLAILALLDDSRQFFRMISQEIYRGQTIRSTYTREKGSGIIGQVARTGSSIHAGNNHALPEYIADGNQPFLSTLAVPMKTGESVIGVLNIESIKPDFFTSEQESFIKSLAGHAAISIENARLLEERNQQIGTLNALRELTLTSSTILERLQLVPQVLKTALRILGGQDGVLFAYDQATHEIVLLNSIRLEGTTLIEAYPILPPDLIYAAAHESRKILIEDIRQHALFQELLAEDYQSLAVLPLQRRGGVSEIMCLTYAEPHYFTARDQYTLDLLAVQIAGHLETAELNETIRNSHNRLRTILDATRDGIILLDRAGRLQDANLAAAHLLDVDLSQRFNTPFRRILPDTTLEDISNTEMLLHESAVSTTREYRLNNRSYPLYIRETSLPVRDAENHLLGHLLILRDISEEKDLAIYRQKIQDMVLHDLSKPLASIISSMDFAQIIVGEADNIETLRTTLQITMDSATNLLNLVASLRDIPRLGKGEISLNPQSVSLIELAVSADLSLTSSLKEAGIHIRYQMSPNAEHAFVDSDLIRRVFINLLHNAYKFTPPGGEILIASDTQGTPEGYIRVLICDSGTGIPEAMRDKIFDEFVQIEGVRPYQGGKGSGVGLAFCKLAVEAHGGKIQVESTSLLSGACFSFTLPASLTALPVKVEES